MQGVGRADVLLYFKGPTTRQMRCPVNAYVHRLKRNDHVGLFEHDRNLRQRGVVKTKAADDLQAVGESLDPLEISIDISIVYSV